MYAGDAAEGDYVMWKLDDFSQDEYWVGIATGRNTDIHIEIWEKTAISHTGEKLTGSSLMEVHRNHIIGLTPPPVRTSHVF